MHDVMVSHDLSDSASHCNYVEVIVILISLLCLMLSMNDRTRGIVLIIVSYLWQVSRSVVLTPRNTLSACRGDEILVKCNESDTAAMISLRWTLTLKNRQIPPVEMTLPHGQFDTPINESSTLLFIAEQQQLLNFLSKLTSYFPLIATFMTTAHPVLNDARLTCQSTLSMDTLTIRIPQTNQPEIHWLNITVEIFEEDNLTIIIEWESDGGSCFNFTVSLASLHEFSSVTIKNTLRHTFNISYNTNYTVVVSSNGGNHSSEVTKTFNFIKCEPPSHQENITVNGYVSPALENSQIFLSCPPGYSFPSRSVISTCTNEATWLPDLSQLALGCQRDCGQLPSNTDVYTIPNDTLSTTVSSIIQFECAAVNNTIHHTECLESGLWQPDPETTCGRGQTTANVEHGQDITVITLGAVIALLCVALLGTCGALFTITIKYKKSRESKRTPDQAIDAIPGSGVLTPNVCYELTEISQKRGVVPGDRVETERNPAYATSPLVSESHVTR